jgi:hypothetical protein
VKTHIGKLAFIRDIATELLCGARCFLMDLFAALEYGLLGHKNILECKWDHLKKYW